MDPVTFDRVQALLTKNYCSKKPLADKKRYPFWLAKRTENDEARRIKERITGMDGQLEALAERIAALPKALAPEPFYKQMERIQDLKRLEEERLQRIEVDPGNHEVPATLPEMAAFLTVLSESALPKHGSLEQPRWQSRHINPVGILRRGIISFGR